MRNNIQLRWIEHAEARQILAESRCEPLPAKPRRTPLRRAAAQWIDRAAGWLMPFTPAGLPVQLQPVRVRRPVRRSRDGERYHCDW